MMKTVSKGVYIVVDPIMDNDKILSQLDKIKNESIAAVQIWDNPKLESVECSLIEQIIELFRNTPTPVMINNKWEMLKLYDLDGVHFDHIPDNLKEIERHLDKPFIKGLTARNDLSFIPVFNEMGFNYLSFCSMFPSSSAGNCEIVEFETIEKCQQLTSKPIFLAGGINMKNIKTIQSLHADGIAVISSIMNSDNPLEQLNLYKNILSL